MLKKNPRRSKFVRAGLLVLIAIYITVCADSYFRQEWYVLELNAVQLGYRASNLQEEPFKLPVQPQDGGPATIHYRKYVTPIARRTEVVFYLHGSKGNMDLCEFQIEFLLDLGYDVWTMDYCGYGDSMGKLGEVALKSDALAVYDLINKELREEPLLYGGDP